MSNKFFRFKQFTVWHDKCAMKTGTDGVLLGAWCPIESKSNACRILDVGTGSGLIALMLAQRCPKARIEAIEIDADAVCQAEENFRLSPWKERLSVQQISLQEFAKEREEQYGLVVSNPPYFVDSLKNPDQQRQAARHTDTLSYSELVCCAAKLLRDNGMLAVIIPTEAKETILEEAAKAGLCLARLVHVYSKPGKPMKRILAAFEKKRFTADTDFSATGVELNSVEEFFIESESSPRSKEYAELTKEFYL